MRQAILWLVVTALFIADAAVHAGVVAHYTFDNTLNDSSANGLNLTTGSGSASYVAGKFGQAVDCINPSGGSGTGNYHYNASSLFEFGTGDFSVAFWYQSDHVNGVLPRPFDIGQLVTKDNHTTANPGWGLRITNDGANNPFLGYLIEPAGSGNTVDFSSTPAPADDNTVYHHLVLQRNGDYMESWLDGVLLDSTPGAGNVDVSAPGYAFAVGARGVLSSGSLASGGGYGLDGRIDELWILNEPLGAAQIADLMTTNTVAATRVTNPSPANGATGVDLEGLTLSWTAPEGGPYAYDIWLKSPLDPDLMLISSAQNGTSYTPSYQAMGNYDWRVDTRSGGLVISTGSVWTFSTISEILPFNEAMYPPDYELPPVRAITQGPKYHWFSYYDVNQFDPTGRYALSMEVDFEHRHPDPDDVIRLGIIDLENNDEWTEIGTTTAWCWQQGCRLQWRPGSDCEVMWNALAPEGDHYITVIKNVWTGQTRTLPRPIYHVHPNGQVALGLDFRRLAWGDPGYGYNCLPDPNRDVNAPTDSGIYLMHLESGNSEMLFSLYDIAQSQSPDKPHYFNAIGWNTDGSRFSFIDRGWGVGRMLTSDAEGNDIRHVCFSPSHYAWRDPSNILIYTPSIQTGGSYKMFEDNGSGDSEVIWEYPNGHQTYFRNNEWILTDTYPLGGERIQHVFLIHVPTNRVFPLGHFPLPSQYLEVRGTSCDLHPRISPDGTKVIIDSPHGGNGRQMYLIDISGILCNPPLLADTNNDCVVDMTDLAQMILEWLRCTHVSGDCL